MKHVFARGLIFTLCIALSPSFVPQVAHGEYRIATVDITRVLNETRESKKAREDLDEASQSAKKQIEKRRRALKAKEEDLRDDNVKASDPEAEAFRKEAKEFTRFVKDTEEELRRKFAKSNNIVTEKALKVVKSYAQKNKIDLILDKGSVGKGPVLFGTAHVDITDKIISEMKG